MAVDERTSLTYLGDGWKVLGDGQVFIYRDGGGRSYGPGESVDLPPPTARS